jgi:acyl carrier protein
MWQFLATTGSVPSYNVYGPTECTVDATVCRVDAATMPSLGRPLSGSKVYLLDEYLEPIPIGVSGEICIGGPSVGRGYLGHPDATAAKFVPDPFSVIVGSRMYRTGDRARHLPDGNIQFIGRMDRQIKIRGFRVELGEVEAALRAHPYVQDAAAVFSSTVSNGKQLRAYVVSSKDLSSGEFRQFLIERVPEYMVPSIVISLPAIPTTPNGKRDYASLPIPDSTILMPAEHYVAPQSALEEQLAELWANVLHTKQIGVHDDFFVLGGDSLLATRLVMRIQDSFSTSVRLLPVFFQKPTIAALAQAISAENPDASAKRSLLMPQSP